MKLEYSELLYANLFGKYYKWWFYCSLLGLATSVILVILTGVPTHPSEPRDFVFIIFAVLFFFSLMLSLGMGLEKKASQKQTAYLKNGKLYFKKVVLTKGGLFEYYYTVLRCDEIKMSKRYIYIFGLVNRTTSEKGFTLKTVKNVKIPRVFNHEETIFQNFNMKHETWGRFRRSKYVGKT